MGYSAPGDSTLYVLLAVLLALGSSLGHLGHLRSFLHCSSSLRNRPRAHLVGHPPVGSIAPDLAETVLGVGAVGSGGPLRGPGASVELYRGSVGDNHNILVHDDFVEPVPQTGFGGREREGDVGARSSVAECFPGIRFQDRITCGLGGNGELAVDVKTAFGTNGSFGVSG